MKVGDLVKMKWTTFVSMRHTQKRGHPVDEIGLVVEEARGAVKVIFPSRGNKVHTFLKAQLGVVNRNISGDE